MADVCCHTEPVKRRSRLRFILEGIEGAVLLGAATATWPISKRWLRDWGASPAECERSWEGDELLSPNLDTHTRAIDIEAPADAVWQWVAQLGLDRAGFYSYELLERIAGIPVTNLESIEPTMQSLAIGDEIRLHPKAPGIPIGRLQTGRHVCFGEEDEGDAPAALRRSWSLYVVPISDSSCRLVVRSCFEETRPRSLPSRLLALAVEEPVDFVMEQRMLRTIKRLAERYVT